MPPCQNAGTTKPPWDGAVPSGGCTTRSRSPAAEAEPVIYSTGAMESSFQVIGVFFPFVNAQDSNEDFCLISSLPTKPSWDVACNTTWCPEHCILYKFLCVLMYSFWLWLLYSFIPTWYFSCQHGDTNFANQSSQTSTWACWLTQAGVKSWTTDDVPSSLLLHNIFIFDTFISLTWRRGFQSWRHLWVGFSKREWTQQNSHTAVIKCQNCAKCGTFKCPHCHSQWWVHNIPVWPGKGSSPGHSYLF